jgi:geranylgeranyl diphosphate synthase type II
MDKIVMIENELKRLMVEADCPPALHEAMMYSLFPGGKRIRPLLLLTVCEMFGSAPSEALPFACALEMIHRYSLIHDDLPAMDNDDFRNSMPTNHKVFGEGMAILAGDGLLNRAYEVMAESCLARSPNAHFLRAMAKIARYAGIAGMVGGQSLDIQLNHDVQSKGAMPTEVQLTTIYTGKTGKLFMAAFAAGALCAHQDDNTVSYMEGIGLKLGLAFQTKDDLEDTLINTIALGGETQAEIRFQVLLNDTLTALKPLPNSEVLADLIANNIFK